MAVDPEKTLCWSDRGWEDFEYWLDQDKQKAKKVRKLIEECQRTPFSGTGKPEALKGNLAGFWSRRIDQTHRLVYAYDDNGLFILQCRYHYSK